MPATRAALRGRLRRAQILVGAAVVALTGGLTAAVAGAIPGRTTVRMPAPDPFAEPLTAFPATGAGEAPVSTSAAPVAVSGAS